MSWPHQPFESLYAIPSRNGLNRPSSVRGYGIKMINMGELFAHDRIGNIDMELVTVNERESREMLVEESDLLFARQSLVLSGAGKCSIVKEVEEPTTFESHIIRVRLNKALSDPLFYHYYFKSPLSSMVSIVTQGVQAGIRGSDLKQLPVPVPSIDIQNQIASILSTYDTLIETNRRRMSLLVESARLLYQEWFVRLRFPGHEYTRVVDGVPERWELAPFEEALVLQRGFDLPVQDRQEGNVPIYGSMGINGYHNKAKVSGPGIVTGRSGTLGEVQYIPEDFWPLNTSLWVKEFKKVSPFFALYMMREMDLKQYNGGASVPTLDRKAVHRLEILVPPAKLLSAFDEFCNPIFLQIANLKMQNEKLRTARDLLLPRLMSGEIAV